MNQDTLDALKKGTDATERTSMLNHGGSDGKPPQHNRESCKRSACLLLYTYF